MSVPYIFANLAGPIPLTDLDYNFAAVEADIASLANGSTPMTTPVLGIPASGNLTNCTNYNSANLAGTIANSQLAYSSITINGSTIVLGSSTTVTANTTNNLTFNNSGSGVASGSSFNGSTAYTISYNTIGASPLAGSTSLTTLGTITTGTWNASTIAILYGGTGATTASGARTNLGLGSAALLTAGTSANNAVQLDGSAKLPAVDGSQLTNLPLSNSMTLLGTLTTTSGASQSLTGLTLTSYKQLLYVFNGVNTTASSTISIGTAQIRSASTTAIYGQSWIDLTTGYSAPITSVAFTAAANAGYSTATTSVNINTSGTFNAGSVQIYGIK